MKFSGKLFMTVGTNEDCRVTEAVLTPKRISIDWMEDGDIGHLDANSRDGVNFHGHYGYPESNPDYEFHLKVYRAKNDVLVFGSWYQHDSGEEGIWSFCLTRDELVERAPAKQGIGVAAKKLDRGPLASTTPSRAKSDSGATKQPRAAKRNSPATKTSASTITLKRLTSLTDAEIRALDQGELRSELSNATKAALLRLHNLSKSQVLVEKIEPLIGLVDRGSSNKRRSTNANSSAKLLSASRQFGGVRHGRKFKRNRKWFLTTRKGVTIATFTTEKELQLFWGELQRKNGRHPNALIAQPPPSGSVRKTTVAKQRVRARSKPRASPRGHGNREINLSDAEYVDSSKTWSEKYGMPEYDFE